MDEGGSLSACNRVTRAEVRPVAGSHARLRIAASITLYDVSTGQSLYVCIERTTRYNVLKYLTNWRVIKSGSVGHDFG